MALVLGLAVGMARNPRLGIACLIVWLASQPVVVGLFIRDLVRVSRAGETGKPTLRGWTLLLVVLVNVLLVASVVGISLLAALG